MSLQPSLSTAESTIIDSSIVETPATIASSHHLVSAPVLSNPQPAASNEKHFEAGTVASTSHSCNPVPLAGISDRHAYPPANWSSPEIPFSPFCRTSLSWIFELGRDLNNSRGTKYLCISGELIVKKSWISMAD